MNQAALRKYLKYLLRELHLGEWAITLGEPLPSDDGSWATIQVTEGQRHATLRIDPGLFQQSPEHVRWVLTHEVLHIHGNPMLESIRSVEGLIGAPAYAVLRHDFVLAAERCNDAIARVLAEHLALPAMKGRK